jgi:hypothetical protein
MTLKHTINLVRKKIMGSRLNINLVELLNSPFIKVEFETMRQEDPQPDHQTESDENIKPIYDTNNCIVTFQNQQDQMACHDFVHVFDHHVHEGRIELSCDWNFFRYGVQDQGVKLLKVLFEHSVSFTVHH